MSVSEARAPVLFLHWYSNGEDLERIGMEMNVGKVGVSEKILLILNNERHQGHPTTRPATL